MDTKTICLLLFSFICLNEARVISKSPQQGLLVTQGGEDPDPEINQKREFVKQMMKDAWDDYVRYAWCENELKPISQTGQDGGIYGGSKIGAKIIDSLDTLFIMGFYEEYIVGEEAK